MSSRADELRRRRDLLLAQVDADRRLLIAQYARIAGGLNRADGWLTVARRVTPVAAIGAITLGLLVGPGRILRMLQAATLPVLLVRQILGQSSSSTADAIGAALRLFRRRQ